MAALLERHLEQIELCSATISELPFPPPSIFTNALLNLADITALIRDPDAHESALFSVVPPSEISTVRDVNEEAGRRSTFFDVNDSAVNNKGRFQPPRRNTAVAAVLGGAMAERIRRERIGDGQGQRRRTGVQKDEVDMELLLKGAEKLCKVYPMPGALDRIAALRVKHDKIAASIDHFEVLVAKQNAQLKKINRPRSRVGDDEDDGPAGSDPFARHEQQHLTQEDSQRDEENIKELERRKKTLEERVSGMKKDLGGILR